MPAEVNKPLECSPQDFLDSLELLLALAPPEQRKLSSAQVELVNRDQLAKGPGGIHRADQFPYLRLSKQTNPLGETIYSIRGGDSMRVVRDGGKGDYLQDDYVIRNHQLQRHTRGQVELTNGTLTDNKSDYKVVPQEELAGSHGRLLSGANLQLYGEFEKTKPWPLLKWAARQAVTMFGKSSRKPPRPSHSLRQ